MGSIPAYSIPREYVPKFLVFLTYEEALGLWSIGENNFADECIDGP